MDKNFRQLRGKRMDWGSERPSKRVRIEEPADESSSMIDPALSNFNYPEPPSPPRPYHETNDVQHAASHSASETESDVAISSISEVHDEDPPHLTDARINEALDGDWFESILATGGGEIRDPDYTFTNEWNSSEDDMSDGPRPRHEGRREARGERARGRGRSRGRPRGSRAGASSTRGQSRKQPSDDIGRSSRRRRAPGSRREMAQRGPRGPRKQPEASPEVAALLQRSNAALLDGDFDIALGAASEAIKLNPEIHQAHILASDALDKLGRHEDSIDALQIASSAYNDSDLLKDVARRIEEKNENFKYDDRLKELYTRIVDRSKGRWDYPARRKRLDINLRKKHIGHAISDCVEILLKHPLELEVLQILAEIGPKNKDHQKVVDAFDEAFNAARSARNAGKHEEADKFDLGLLNVYLDLLLEWKQYQRGITQLKQMARWIMGREQEYFWDDVVDDREWDDDDFPRRQEVTLHVPGQFDQSCYELPIELRIKLGLYRFHVEPPDHEEAGRHFKCLTPDDHSADAPVNEFPDLFQDVGRAYAGLRTTDGYREAIGYLHPLADTAPTGFDLTEAWSIMAACYMSLHSFDKSVRSYLDEAEKSYLEYLKIGPEKSAARIKLIDIYLGQGREHEAQQLVFDVEDKKRYLLSKMQAQHLLNPQYVAQDSPNLSRHAKAPGGAEHGRTRDFSGLAHPDSPKVYLTKSESLAEASRLGLRPTPRSQQIRGSTKDTSRLSAPGPGDAKQDSSHSKNTNEDAAKPDTEPTDDETPDISHETPLAAAEQLGVDGKPRRYGRPKLKITQRKRRNLLPPEMDAVAIDRAQRIWTKMLEIEPGLEAEESTAELQWINLGIHLAEDFINEERHYPNRDKHKQFTGYGGTGKWYQYDLKTETFRNIRFEVWAEMFCRLALLQAKHHTKLQSGQTIPSTEGNEEQEVGDELDDNIQDKKTLKHQKAVKGYSMMASMRTIAYAANAHPFHHNQAQTWHIHATWLACALALQEEEYVQQECRYFAKAYPEQSDTFRLYSIASRLYPTKDRTWYNAGPNQKYLLRQIKAMDYAVLPAASRRIFKLSDQERKGLNKNIKEKAQTMTDLDPTLLALYGHIIMAGGILNNALYYYFRALAIVPEDPVINLCIANCFLVQGFKRLTVNRTYYMQLGQAFLHRYYTFRTSTGVKVHLQEAEFNMGHMWHLLGLVELAVPRYEKVLALSGEVRLEMQTRVAGAPAGEDFAADAAMALSTIMATNGAVAQARRLREKWMTI